MSLCNWINITGSPPPLVYHAVELGNLGFLSSFPEAQTPNRSQHQCSKLAFWIHAAQAEQSGKNAGKHILTVWFQTHALVRRIAPEGVATGAWTRAVRISAPRPARHVIQHASATPHAITRLRAHSWLVPVWIVFHLLYICMAGRSDAELWRR